jgi:hypothetical protein
MKAFFEKAENGRIAAQRTRFRSRVKHDHKDAILSVDEINEIEYVAGRQAQKKDPFFNSFNIQQQRMNFDKVSDAIFDEVSKKKHKDENDLLGRRKKLFALHRLERKKERFSGSLI